MRKPRRRFGLLSLPPEGLLALICVAVIGFAVLQLWRWW